jgi:glutamate 5-kinase
VVSVIERGTLRRIAEARQVDASPEALRAVADGPSSPPTWKSLASASLLPLIMKKSLRKAMVLFAAARRADDVLQSFAVATLFDHYCAQLHVGAGLDVASGRLLRADMDAVLGSARGHVVSRLFRRALSATGRAAVRAPLELADIASAGFLSRLRGKGRGPRGRSGRAHRGRGAEGRRARLPGQDRRRRRRGCVHRGPGVRAAHRRRVRAAPEVARVSFPGAEERARLAHARRVVVKIGSRLLRDSPVGRTAAIADEIAALRKERGTQVTVVSSGAIALGMRLLGLPAKPAEIPKLQACAAVGQSVLMQHWERAFSVHDHAVGQVLLTHDDVDDRARFLQARHALEALLEYGAVPIVNENDTVATDEIKFGDNDRLAALVCNLVRADALVILTDVDGLHDADPRAGGKRIPVVRDIDAEATPVAGGTSVGGVGTGGMASKVQAAKIAAKVGVPTVVAFGRRPDVLASVLGGADLGTIFVPHRQPLAARKHWIAYASGPRAPWWSTRARATPW